MEIPGSYPNPRLSVGLCLALPRWWMVGSSGRWGRWVPQRGFLGSRGNLQKATGILSCLFTMGRARDGRRDVWVRRMNVGVWQNAGSAHVYLSPGIEVTTTSYASWPVCAYLHGCGVHASLAESERGMNRKRNGGGLHTQQQHSLVGRDSFCHSSFLHYFFHPIPYVRM